MEVMKIGGKKGQRKYEINKWRRRRQKSLGTRENVHKREAKFLVFRKVNRAP